MRYDRRILGTDPYGLLTLGAALLLAVIGLAGGIGSAEARSATILPDEGEQTSALCRTGRGVLKGGAGGGFRSREQELHADVLRGGRDLRIEPRACEER